MPWRPSFLPGWAPPRGRLLRVPQGTRVLQAVAPAGVSFASPSAQFFVLRDEVALPAATS